MKPDKSADQKSDPAPGTDMTVAPIGGALAVVDFGDDAGKGLQNIKPEERKIPFVRILQSNSPQCEDGNAKFMPHAKAGMFINTSTNQLFKSLIMIPCARDHKFVEYTPRAIGGGFVAIHKPDDQLILMLRAKQGKFGRLSRDVTKRDQQGNALDGTEIVEAFELYSIFIDPETGGKFRGVAAFSSTQIGKYQTLVDRADGIQYQTPDEKIVTAPFWAHKWLMTTGNEKNKKGSFKGFVIGLLAKKEDGSDDSPIKSLIKRSDPLYEEGRVFNAFVEAGKAEVDYEVDAKTGAAKDDKDEVEM